ncbi:MAG TPA: pseudouridine-5'-phosphate glycosidase [Candidatus Acidoferrum sp.]|nr:pseudouridine-5'-phosphate glycosidase [Candidatus Acidoferrum sp.]
MEKFLAVREDVATAIAAGQPVVALESTVIAHGLPRPLNLQTAHAMEVAVREAGATPATVGVLNGRLVVGLTPEQIAFLSEAESVAKVSRADLAAVLASGRPGATTVAGTMIAADMAGIRVFATGGIGGVHRGGENSMDISADLTELARTPVAVVCAGAKAILDLPRTLEVLETLGVPVVGYATKEFPAFYSRESGLPLVHCVKTPDEAAKVMRAQWGSSRRGTGEGAKTGVVFANPAPRESALSRAEIEAFIAAALRAAEIAGVRGKNVTPFLLQEVARLSGGKTLKANIGLLVANATLAAQIAVAYSILR